ncbi:DICT sensory domain-containing protein [Haloparvum sp. AD34]
MNLREFIETTESSSLSLVLVNYEAPDPIRTMFEDLFADQPVDVDERELEREATNMVYLLDGQEVVASSTLAELRDAILLINSDLYVTGSGGMKNLEMPAVIDGLTDTRFNLRGYPESNKEKLLLITVSRYIERLALEHEGGRHRASFQRLSRIDDEQGTRSVYERLANSDTDTHVYGVPDWQPEPEFDVTMHGGWSEEFQDAWFVVYVPEDGTSPHAALVAVETGPRRWDGFWTYDEERVVAINKYVQRNL